MRVYYEDELYRLVDFSGLNRAILLNDTDGTFMLVDIKDIVAASHYEAS